MAAVECGGVDGIKARHAAREVGLGGLHQQVVVVVHQAVGVEPPALLLNLLAEALQEPPPVLIVEKDRCPRVAARGEMVERPGKFEPQRASHDVGREAADVLERQNTGRGL